MLPHFHCHGTYTGMHKAQQGSSGASKDLWATFRMCLLSCICETNFVLLAEMLVTNIKAQQVV